ncbi:MAG: hypothetical protein JKY09_08250 [Crocinitomicaceae bacterium]|nr:hypothetical protein [Crocinitomicaceae bacterium]
MKKINLLLSAMAMVFSLTLFAQEATITNVLNLKSVKQSGQIIENDKLVGYYVFYFKEKNDKKTATYEVEFFDNNYNSINSFEVTRPKKSYLLEMVYNGEVFMLFFYDRKTGYEFVSFDKTGKKLGNHLIPKKSISSFDLQKSTVALSSGTENVTIYPLGNEGFVRQTYTKSKKVGYEFVAYDNEMNELWSYGSPLSSKLIETAEISEVSDKFVTATIYRKKGLMTKKMDLAFVILDAKSGELVSEMEMGNADEGKESVLKTYFDEAQEKIVLIGEFYKPGDDILKDKSQGLFIKELGEDGAELTINQYKWKGHIDKFKNENLSEEDKKEAKAAFSIFFHDAIRSENGNLFLIGEQFRKQLSAGGTALNMLAAASGGSSDAAAFEIRVSNMIVIEFDKKNNLVGFNVIKKKKTSVLLPKGAGLWGTAFLGYYINSIGGFDYSFTSADKNSDVYSVVYTDYNRKLEKGEKKSDKMLGIIQIEAGKMEASRVPINTNAKRWWIQPAKPGHISITEYYKKEKKLSMRLEQLTY